MSDGDDFDWRVSIRFPGIAMIEGYWEPYGAHDDRLGRTVVKHAYTVDVLWLGPMRADYFDRMNIRVNIRDRFNTLAEAVAKVEEYKRTLAIEVAKLALGIKDRGGDYIG